MVKRERKFLSPHVAGNCLDQKIHFHNKILNCVTKEKEMNKKPKRIEENAFISTMGLIKEVLTKLRPILSFYSNINLLSYQNIQLKSFQKSDQLAEPKQDGF